MMKKKKKRERNETEKNHQISFFEHTRRFFSGEPSVSFAGDLFALRVFIRQVMH